ncbi:DUF4340 domain-containing protein [bacterium]|nr:DUF4340 domain-containing protein [bacterium]
MKIRYNFIFIPLLIICAIAVWYIGFRKETQVAAKRLADRSLLDASEMDIIEITRGDETIRFEKTGLSDREVDIWLIVNPYEADTNPDSMAGIVDAILAVESEKDIAGVTDVQRAEYGLAEPYTRIRLMSSSGSILMDLSIGMENISSTARYAMFTDKPSNAFLIPVYQIWPFEITADDLRDARALVFDTEVLTAIQISSVQGEINLVNDDGTWMIRGPERFAASPARLALFFDHIKRLEAVEFLPENANDPELDKKSTQVTFEAVDGTRSILTLHDEDYQRGIFASSSSQPTPFIVEAYIYDRLALDPAIFFHVQLFDFPPDEIERLYVREPGSSNLEIQRLDGVHGRWEILKPEDRAGTFNDGFQAFIDSLYDLTPEYRINPPERMGAYGIEPVYYLKVEVFRGEEMEKVEFKLGSRDSNGNFYATQDGLSYFTIAGELVDRFVSAVAILKGIDQ